MEQLEQKNKKIVISNDEMQTQISEQEKKN
jgi:hypothetical protein